MFDPECPSRAAPIRIADKWGGMIILCLEGGPRRFSELLVPLRRITPKVLTESLRALERDGMVTRTAYDENPPRVEYQLTSLGRSLLGMIATCRDWAAQHLDELREARETWQATRVYASRDRGGLAIGEAGTAGSR
jgi:DNA-binding HxlR family transcriptional regulator